MQIIIRLGHSIRIKHKHIYYNTEIHHVAVVRPAIHAGANTGPSCINNYT